MSFAGFGPLCFIKSKVSTAVNQDILEHFIIPFADKLCREIYFIFQQGSAPVHPVKNYQYLD